MGLSLGPLQPAEDIGLTLEEEKDEGAEYESIGMGAEGEEEEAEEEEEEGEGEYESIGMGAEVGEVDVGGAAERAGVRPGMIFSRLEQPDIQVKYRYMDRWIDR